MTVTAQALRALPEYELDNEFEDVLESEFETEFEAQFENEFELEDETEEFFRTIGGLARRAARHPGLRRAGLAAARSALRGLGDVGAAIGGPPGTRGARIGGTAGAAVGRILRDLLPRREFEAEINPIRKAYPDALMEHLGHAAAATESEEEAEAFVGALIPLVTRVVPRAAPAIMRAVPQLARGVAAATRTLRSNPATRPLVRTMPTVVQRTAQSLARQAAAGQPVTPRQAVRTLAGQTARVISSPQACTAAYRRSRQLDTRYHRSHSGGVARGR
jgi:hypothetical protein